MPSLFPHMFIFIRKKKITHNFQEKMVILITGYHFKNLFFALSSF